MLKFIRPCLVTSMIWLLLVASAASAHAFPDKSEPSVGASINGSVDRVRVWFDAEIEPVFSSLRIIDAQGRQVNQGAGQVNPADGHLLEATVPRLAPGIYRVAWRVVARDGHTTEGDYQFTVGQ